MVSTNGSTISDAVTTCSFSEEGGGGAWGVGCGGGGGKGKSLGVE